MLVNNKSDSPRYIGVYLQPGVNELDEQQSKQFLAVYENPTLQHIVTDDIEVTTKESNEEFSFASLNATEAIELVRGTLDIGLLEEFRKDELANGNRKTVLEAIDKQLSNLEEPPTADETTEG